MWCSGTLDLIGNRLINHIPRYVSPYADGQAFPRDALVYTWPHEVCRSFPLFTILDHILLKILQERPQRLLHVDPMRLLAPWFLRLHVLP